MINLREKMEELKSSMNAISRDFVYDYDLDNSDYICDAFMECANSKVDFYYSSILDWARDNISQVNRGIEEFGSSGDIFKDLQASQYLCNSEDLYEDYSNIILYLICEYLVSLDIEELNDEEWEEIETEDFDHNDRFSDVLDWLKDNIFEKINVEDSTFEVDE